MGSEESERLVDTLLAVATIGVAAVLMFAQARDASPDADPASGAAREIGVGEIRSIEDAGLTLDGDKSLAASVKSAIGLDGHPEAGPQAVLTKLRDDIRRSYPTSRHARLAWIAMAAGFRLDAQAQAEVADLVRDPKFPAKQRPTLDALADLASGRGVSSLPALDGALEDLGASRWLVARVHERHLANIGAEAARVDADRAAVEIAAAAMDRRAAVSLVELGLWVLGLLVVLLFPWFVRPRLEEAGYPGLATPSPFRLDRTRRVMLAWFLGYTLLSYVLQLLFALLGPPADPSEGYQRTAVFIAVSALVQGFAGVAFIRAWGRTSDDHTPLGPELGLSTKPLPRRLMGLLMWSVPGASALMVVTTLALSLSVAVFGPPTALQTALQVVSGDGRPETFALITLAAVVISPVMEEILFRGFLFRNLRDTMGRGPAVLVSGLIFAVIHLEPALIVPLAAMGAALALLYEWSGSLLVPIMAHALWNMLHLVKTQVAFHV
ncbi:MAG: type II CAAX endopeptidase family protein [Myxococcota bacterium]